MKTKQISQKQKISGLEYKMKAKFPESQFICQNIYPNLFIWKRPTEWNKYPNLRHIFTDFFFEMYSLTENVGKNNRYMLLL